MNESLLAEKDQSRTDSPSPLTGRSQSWRHFLVENRIQLLCLVLFFVTWKTFVTCVGNEFVNYDDPEYISDNPHVQAGLKWSTVRWAFTSLTGANWHPLTMLSHILDWQIFGARPWGHHLVNVLIHCFNVVLVFVLINRATGKTWQSFFVAALFGLHPLRVESVAWVSERKDVLSTLFFLLAALAYVQYVGALRRQEAASKRYFYLSFAWCFLGLLSKPMLVTFPLAILILDFWPLERWPGESWRRLLIEKIPFICLSGLFCLITCIAQREALQSLSDVPFSERFQNIPVSYCRYIGNIFFPQDLAVFYPYPIHWPAGQVIVSTILVLIITAVAILKAKRNPFILMGWLWFLCTLMPVIGIVQVGVQSMADRYTYVPSLGITIAVVWYVFESAQHFRLPVQYLSAGLAVICLLFGLETRTQIGYWKDGGTLFRHAAAVTENNYVADILVGFSEIENNNYEAAIWNFHKGLTIKGNDVLGHVGLGVALTKVGDPKGALDVFNEGLQLDPDNPDCHKEIAAALVALGRRSEAITNLEYSLKIRPDDAEAQQKLFELTNSVPKGKVAKVNSVKPSNNGSP